MAMTAGCENVVSYQTTITIGTNCLARRKRRTSLVTVGRILELQFERQSRMCVLSSDTHLQSVSNDHPDHCARRSKT